MLYSREKKKKKPLYIGKVLLLYSKEEVLLTIYSRKKNEEEALLTIYRKSFIYIGGGVCKAVMRHMLKSCLYIGEEKVFIVKKITYAARMAWEWLRILYRKANI